MDSQEQQLIDRIKQAQNVLVTVSSNPSVDQLAAAIGLTIALNKLDKHGTAVFSGQIPSTIEFLKPEDTLERNTDSLRDFIIALDKSKADKLRYKVEDQVVRIFITPYRTSLSDKDLQFSQGDFNVDVVVALGVAEQKELDAAITAHGRILHDATVASVSVDGKGDLGTISWRDEHASSLSEMMLGLIDGLDKNVMDNQIATALLTGIVATTDRFRNERTTPKVMNASAELMAAGANQQLIASELDTTPVPSAPSQGHIHEDKAPPAADRADAGTLDIDHTAGSGGTAPRPEEYRAPTPEADLGVERPKDPEPQIHVDDSGKLSPAPAMPMGPMGPFGPPPPSISQVHVVEPDGAGAQEGSHRDRVMDPPSTGGSLTAAHTDDTYDPSTEALTLPPVASAAPLLTHNESVLPSAAPRPKPIDESPFIPQEPLPAIPPPPAPPALPMMSPPPLPLPPSAPAVPPPPDGQMPPAAPDPAAPPTAQDDKTLQDLEQAVRSPHLEQPGPITTGMPAAPPATGVDDARNAVQAAFSSAADTAPPRPIAALNALPLGPELHPMPAPPTMPNPGPSQSAPVGPPPSPPLSPSAPGPVLDMPLPSNPFGPGQQTGLPPLPGTAQQSAASDVPSVPPPFVPPLPQ